MKSLKVITLIVFSLFIKTPLNAQWSNVGSTFLSDNSGRDTKIVANSTGVYVAFIENNKANVRKYTGTSWEVVGIPDFSPNNIQFLSLAVEETTPYVVFKDNSNGGKASVMKFNGSTWVFVGSQGFSTGSVQYTKISISNGVPYVAFQNIGSQKTSVMSFNGTTWDFVGVSEIGIGSTWNIQFEIKNNIPYLSFREFISGVNTLRVMKFDGINWLYEGNVVENLVQNTDGSNPLVNSSIAFEPITFIPLISYIIKNPLDAVSSIVVTKKLSGSNWVAVGNPISNAVNFINDNLKLVFFNNKPTVAFTGTSNSGPDTKVSVSEFDGTSWNYLGGNVFASIGSIGTVNLPSDKEINIYPLNNELFLSYTEDNPENGRVRVRKFVTTLLSILDYNTLNDEIIVYPNPSTGIFNIKTSLINYNWNVYNGLGQIILKDVTNKVDLTGFSNGNYILKIIDKENVLKTYKLIKK